MKKSIYWEKIFVNDEVNQINCQNIQPAHTTQQPKQAN